MGKDYCSNPYNKPRHKYSKSGRTGVRQVTQAKEIDYFKSRFPKVTLPYYLCVRCRLEFEKDAKDIREPVPEPEPSADPGQWRDQGEESGDEYESPETKKVDLNATLRSANISPLKKVGRIRDLARELKDKYQKVKAGFKRGYQQITQQDPTTLSPTKPEPQAGPSRRGCDACDDLTTRFAQVYPFRAETRKEKFQILTSLPAHIRIQDIRDQFHVNEYMARQASSLRSTKGPFSFPNPRTGRKLSEQTVEAIEEFYLNPQYSRTSPKARDTLFVKNKTTGQRELVAKQEMLVTLDELYESYIEKYDCKNKPEYRVSISKFASLRPKQCVWANHKGFHSTCVCVIHENFRLLLSACLIEMIDTNQTLDPLFCNIQNPHCMLGTCRLCPLKPQCEALFKNIAGDAKIEFMQWISTDRMDLQTTIEDFEQFKTRVLNFIPKIGAHHFTHRKQIQFLNNLQEKVKRENSMILQVDFGANYEFVIQNEVQGFHWTNNQATIHPFVCRYYENYDTKISMKNYVVISDELEHSGTSFHVFRAAVLFHMKENGFLGRFQKIYYVSDGAAMQYKNYKNFTNLLYHEREFNIAAEWHFTATAHGKSTCDAISAVVKRATRLESLKPGVFILNPLDMWVFCSNRKIGEDTTFLYVPKEDVADARMTLNERYSDAKTVKGTRNNHSFIPVSDTRLQIRKFSASAEYKVVTVISEGWNPLQEPEADPIVVSVGQYISFIKNDTWQLGVVNIDEQVFNDGEVFVHIMRRSLKGTSFTWNGPLNEDWVEVTNILRICNPPVTQNGRTYNLDQWDYHESERLFMNRLQG